MDRKTFLGAAPTVPLAALGVNPFAKPLATPERDSVTISLVVGNRTSEYSFFIDEHSTNLLWMFEAICVAARGEYMSRVVLPRQERSEA